MPWITAVHYYLMTLICDRPEQHLKPGNCDVNCDNWTFYLHLYLFSFLSRRRGLRNDRRHEKAPRARQVRWRKGTVRRTVGERLHAGRRWPQSTVVTLLFRWMKHNTPFLKHVFFAAHFHWNKRGKNRYPNTKHTSLVHRHSIQQFHFESASWACAPM